MMPSNSSGFCSDFIYQMRDKISNCGDSTLAELIITGPTKFLIPSVLRPLFKSLKSKFKHYFLSVQALLRLSRISVVCVVVDVTDPKNLTDPT